MIRIMLSKKLGELRITQSQLAKATKIRAATINEYYNELTDRVNLVYLDRICDALGCDLSELIERVPNEDPEIRQIKKKPIGR